MSVTDRCNLRCRYCMPARGVSFVPHAELPSLEKLRAAVAWLVVRCGVDRVKLTGGEPLVRRGVVDLVRGLVGIPGVREVSMTTNGAGLASLARPLADAGLARVNVSLDSLDPERFATLTRGGDVAEVLSGVDAALAAGLVPLKLNAVLRASTWRVDVPELLDFAAARGLEPRFIELMHTGTEAAWAAAEHVAASEVRVLLERDGLLLPLPGPAAAPARRTLVRWHGTDLAVGWITPISHHFCGACDRLRLDARGRLRRCLMDPVTLPLVQLLGSGRKDEALSRVGGYLAAKVPPVAMDTASPMVAIGG
ncbi:MAG: radical SAM protein [Acidobacteriota bacterium]